MTNMAGTEFGHRRRTTLLQSIEALVVLLPFSTPPLERPATSFPADGSQSPAISQRTIFITILSIIYCYIAIDHGWQATHAFRHANASQAVVNKGNFRPVRSA
ncbi:MAG: hypothetical protein NTW01_01035 [Gammaproteobacteria bacterium]|nr:hypothetical protein [Gammaproteobacteria bacterium]